MPHVQLKTVTGHAIDITLPPAASVAAVKRELCDKYEYATGVKLMYQGKVLKDESRFDQYPFGGVLVIGQKAKRKAESPEHGDFYSNRTRASGAGMESVPTQASPQPSQRPTAHRGSPQAASSPQAHQQHHHASPQPAARSFQQPPPPPGFGGPSPQPAASPVNDARSPGARSPKPPTMDVICLVPSKQGQLTVSVPNAGGLVSDLSKALTARDPSLMGSKIIFNGKILSNPNAELYGFGIHEGSKVHVASGNYSNPDAVQLLQIKETYEEIYLKLQRPTVTDLEKKQYNEDLMRLLYRLDGLMDMPDELRAQRKALVKAIMAIQDAA